MKTAWRRRTTWAIAASILAHLGVLTVVLLQRPTLTIPDESAGPPQAIIPVLILPRAPAPAAGGVRRPTPIQLHRRPQRNPPAESPVAPIVVPAPRAAEAPAQAQAPAAVKAPQPPPAAPESVRAALRTTLGCTEQRLAGMGREERAGCLERLGRGARDAPYLAPALSPEKRALLDQAGAAKMAQKLAGERGVAAPSPSSKAEPSDYSGEPDIASNVMTPASHPGSKRAAKVLGPLPP